MHADKMQFKIAGMDCAEEVSVLKKELGPIVGGDGNLSFDVLNEILTVTCCSIDVPPETIQTAVARTGMAEASSVSDVFPGMGPFAADSHQWSADAVGLCHSSCHDTEHSGCNRFGRDGTDASDPFASSDIVWPGNFDRSVVRTAASVSGTPTTSARYEFADDDFRRWGRCNR